MPGRRERQQPSQTLRRAKGMPLLHPLCQAPRRARVPCGERRTVVEAVIPSAVYGPDPSAVASAKANVPADNAHGNLVPLQRDCAEDSARYSIRASNTWGADAHRPKNITGDPNPPAQPFGRRAEFLWNSAADYSCCFTKFPFGSTSNRDSLPFALTNTS